MDENAWRRFVVVLAGWTAGLLALLAALLIVTDPYGSVPFAPRLPRALMDGNQRWMYPQVARDPRFDSIILGTSTLRPLRPERLDAATGARFANLAMNSATAWEQLQLGRLFLRHHPAPRHVVIGIDANWCAPEGTSERITFRGFPDHLYDDDGWNDWPYLLNGRAVEVGLRMVAWWLGLEQPRYRDDGWADDLPEEEGWRLDVVRHRLYGGAPRWDAEPPDGPPPERFAFDDHELMAELIAAIPPEAMPVLVFVPYHRQLQGAPGSLRHARQEACKAQLADLARAHPRARLLDLMIDSPLTTDDANYWDPMHYRIGPADVIADAIGAALADPAATSPILTVRR